MLTDFARVSAYSIGLPWCWNGPSIAKLLPVQILPLVEHCLSTSGLGTYKWRNEAYQFALLLLLQFTSHTGRDGLDYH